MTALLSYAQEPRTSLRDKLLAHISTDQLHVALIQQRQRQMLLGECVVALGFLDGPTLQPILSEHTGYPWVRLDQRAITLEIAHVLDRSLCERLRAIVFHQDGRGYHVAMADPEDIFAQDELCDRLGDYLAYHCDPNDIGQAIIRLFRDPAERMDENIDISQILDDIIRQAAQNHASDIHIQPEESAVHIKLRCDGILSRHMSLHKTLWSTLLVRLKVMAGLDIAETRRPQSGQLSYHIAGRVVSLRISTHPVQDGENIVIRLMDPTQNLLSLKDLGFCQQHLDLLQQLTQLTEGLIVFCGPTGSGKTTSLYGLLRAMNPQTRNIMTLEQPIECDLPHVRQTEIITDELMGYAEGIRSLLRQDPDVMMIGEIRDEETAQMTFRAAMTGHLVLSTLHTPDVLGVPARLKDLGVSTSIMSDYLKAIISQRLVRRVCAHCKGQGCLSCANSGFKGRTVVAEILVIDDMVREILAQTTDRGFLTSHLATFYDMRQDAKRCESQGLTAFSEIERVFGCRV